MGPICLEHLGSLYFRGGEEEGLKSKVVNLLLTLLNRNSLAACCSNELHQPNTARSECYIAWSPFFRGTPPNLSIFIPQESQAIRIKPTPVEDHRTSSQASKLR